MDKVGIQNTWRMLFGTHQGRIPFILSNEMYKEIYKALSKKIECLL